MDIPYCSTDAVLYTLLIHTTKIDTWKQNKILTLKARNAKHAYARNIYIENKHKTDEPTILRCLYRKMEQSKYKQSRCLKPGN